MTMCAEMENCIAYAEWLTDDQRCIVYKEIEEFEGNREFEGNLDSNYGCFVKAPKLTNEDYPEKVCSRPN